MRGLERRGRDDEGTPVRDPGSVTYSAAIESAAQTDTNDVPSQFAARVERETTRRGFDRAARRAVLGDGAKWIWNLATEYSPDAIQIVDRYHAKQHLSDVAKSIYGAGSHRAAQWAREGHDELDAGDLDAVLAVLRVHAPNDDERTRASTTSPATTHACATGSSTLPGSARRAVWSRPAARSRSAHASSAPACTGPSPAPTRSWSCAVAN